ncbi:hypothetical protein ACFSR9_03525 [Deinococcus taklimakanensis]|uniref:Uncharacterized protein n=1 Tax=Deinococcus taklimakanensis TaxID=536443 RepID=A0ABW5P1Z7_9DEIO
MATLAEAARIARNNTTQFPNTANCVPLVLDALPSAVTDCQLRQDANTAYVLSQSQTGMYYLFDGPDIQGPLASSPVSW